MRAWQWISPVGCTYRARERFSVRVDRVRGVGLAIELLGRGHLEKRAAHLLGDDLVPDVFPRLLGGRGGDDELFREVLGQIVVDPGGSLSGIRQERIGVVRTLGMLAHGLASKLIHDACHRGVLVQSPRRIRPIESDATAVCWVISRRSRPWTSSPMRTSPSPARLYSSRTATRSPSSCPTSPMCEASTSSRARTRAAS